MGEGSIKQERRSRQSPPGDSTFDKAEKEVYYGASGPGPLYQRDQMLQDIPPSPADVHPDDGALDFWKIK